MLCSFRSPRVTYVYISIISSVKIIWYVRIYTILHYIIRQCNLAKSSFISDSPPSWFPHVGLWMCQLTSPHCWSLPGLSVVWGQNDRVNLLTELEFLSINKQSVLIEYVVQPRSAAHQITQVLPQPKTTFPVWLQYNGSFSDLMKRKNR